jgi:pimeloyl-ACP methyl ester carboxylesterase
VLVPGFTGSKEDFIAVLLPLARAGYRAVAYDQRGQYETTGPDEPTAYVVDELALDLLAVVDALKARRVHLLGHSFGGLVARSGVVHAPGEFSSLALLCSGPAAIPDQRQCDRLRLMIAGLTDYSLETVWNAMRELARTEGDPGPDDPEVSDFLARRFSANNRFGLIAQAQALIGEPDRLDDLIRVAPPVLVAYGESDDVWPLTVQDRMASRLGVQPQILYGVGHSPAAEDPAQTVELLMRFWGPINGNP